MIGQTARFVACAIAAAAMLDPSMSFQRRKPLAVEFITADSDDAMQVRGQLLRELGGAVEIARRGHRDAVVAIDRDVDMDSIRDDAPVSFVTLDGAANVRLLRANTGGPLFPGQRGAITIDAEVRGLAGRRSRVAVLQNGVETGATEHAWSDRRHQQVIVPYVALVPGSHLVRAVSEPLTEERRTDDNAVDLSVTTVERPFRVAFLERRPSWTARFVRQAIESDPRLQIESITRASPGIDVRSGNPPSLASSLLDDFEVLAIAAPEELTPSDVRQLRTFMSERGGTVLLLPDRRPSGFITSLIPTAGFDERLHSSPVTMDAGRRGNGLRASEFAVPRSPAPSMEPLATLPDGKVVIAAWPIGTGTLIVSGALDAWRYRGSADDAFASFWRAAIVGAARTAPPILSVELHPDVALAGTPVRVTAHVRPTAFEHTPDSVRLPSIRAVAMSEVDSTTRSDFIRLWPASEPGVFQGEFVPAEPRRYTVLVHAGNVDAAATLLPGSATSRGVDGLEAEIVAAATGGVLATADHLAPLVDHLRSRGRGTISSTMHPMRSAWWIFPFTIGLCLEWILRRRRGNA